jgi:hypothetical protein
VIVHQALELLRCLLAALDGGMKKALGFAAAPDCQGSAYLIFDLTEARQTS